MQKINKVIALLLAVYGYAKDIHYNCKGDSFYSKHLLCDRISENIYDYIDSIKEVCFLASEDEPLLSKQYAEMSARVTPDLSSDDKQNFTRLLALVSQTLQAIHDLDNLTKGEDNLFGNIAENLQTSMGLLVRQVQNG